jgi:hypothetical protein
MVDMGRTTRVCIHLFRKHVDTLTYSEGYKHIYQYKFMNRIPDGKI